ncbi:response regulator [Roseimicrobium sp. ORNL1]|uniref:hybrid sensor histidine kinase/response regulator n=1 Tax=Roseimicrobium sp. ORNL1 TaxID=2711231 RepID=UPI0013E10FA0|nr:response regulator [Roseimicrobium sp. ORNL1]QIF02357.1 response regulator [Roseimicrobium sp. ORNL1]
MSEEASTTAPSQTIFVVDDDEGLTRLIARSLRREGYHAETATSGKDAMAWLAEHEASLMLLDLKLADLNATELVERLKGRGRLVPFVIITGQGDERVAVDMMKRGALDYIVKDGQFLELVPTVVHRSLAQVDRERRLVAAEEERKRLEREVLEISEREQRRIGHDLHDGLGQTLAGVDVLLEVLKKRLASNSPGDADAVASISSYVKEAIQQTRMLARGLSPVEVERKGLMSALKALAEHAGLLFKVSCSFECDDAVEVQDHAKATHLYRIAQEAMHNAVRHGKAKHIDIILTQEGPKATLRVVSDGTEGTPVPEISGNGMGLYTMKYRAGMIGGSVEIRPAKPHGTEVVCTFPNG